jgi:sporulation protein YlmC with PRC-barrel domain
MVIGSGFAVMGAFSLLAMVLPFSHPSPVDQNKLGNPPIKKSVPASAPAFEYRMRNSSLIGATVYNERSLSIGVIDDILLDQSDPTDPEDTMAVLAVGPFGSDDKLVKIPYHHLRLSENGAVLLPGITREFIDSMNDCRDEE